MAFIAVLFTLLSLAASHSSGSHNPSRSASVANCSAEITVNSTEPGTAFYIYNDIVVENTGLCDITRVFVNITLPPNDEAFAYYNVSNQTGEIDGFTSPMPQGSVQVGGTIVLNSARIPHVVLLSLECSDSCNAPSDDPTEAPTLVPTAAPTPIPTAPTDSPVDPTEPLTGPATGVVSSDDDPTDASDSPSQLQLQVELKRGSNAYWFGLSVLSGGEALKPNKVQFLDSSSESAWLRMNVASWGNTPTFTFSPASGPLVLPISLRITSATKEVIVLNEVITSFSPSHPVHSSQEAQAIASSDDDASDF